jgi:hypothetical protein
MNIKLNEYSHPSLTLVVVHSIKKKKRWFVCELSFQKSSAYRCHGSNSRSLNQKIRAPRL